VVSQALGLLLTGTLVGLVSQIYRSAMVSEDAAQTAARAHFLIDTISHWISQAEGQVGQPAHDRPFFDPCETPERMPMSLARPGIVLINAATVPCVGLEGVGLEGVVWRPRQCRQRHCCLTVGGSARVSAKGLVFMRLSPLVGP
jgi:hypothetical protein